MLDNYSRFHDGMILRDHLALDRTVLANERTLLAYLRTFIGTLSAGVAMVKLLDNTPWVIAVGYAFIAVSPVFLLYGTVRYMATSRKLSTLGQPVASAAAVEEADIREC